MKLIHIAVLMVLTACTISVNQVHTQGSASDVIDEEQKADADVSPEVSAPVRPF